MEKYTEARPRRKPSSAFEAKRERWQRQLIADRARRGYRGLSSTALAVGLAISLRLNRNSGDAWPGYGRLAYETGALRKSCIAAVRQLGNRGHLKICRTRAGSRNDSNRYEPAKQIAQTRPTCCARARPGAPGCTAQSPTSAGPNILRSGCKMRCVLLRNSRSGRPGGSPMSPDTPPPGSEAC